jgi:adenine-specific DNA-methyltransferase
MNFNEKLENLLKQNENFCDTDGELLKQKIKSLALSFDEELIETLLNNTDTKEHFFKQIGKASIFDYRKLIDFIDDKNFLLDSYTKFSNKVGLTISNKHIKQIDDVVLTFPFKDCILEGGQSKEDENRKEIFFNETLAKDEISRLLDKKVISNATKYYYENNEVQETEDFTFTRDRKINKARGLDEDTITDNLIIKGNNLLALHSLKSNFAGKIKFIYIDPPYNTGNDGFKYNDTFNHSTWLTFMKNRLEIARELLDITGTIAISIDNNEQSYLQVLLDEVFGLKNKKT